MNRKKISISHGGRTRCGKDAAPCRNCMSADAQNQGRSTPRAGKQTSRKGSSTMNDVILSCDCDCVIEMEDMAVGVPEMLQYAHAVLSRREVRELLEGLECTLRGDSLPCSAPRHPALSCAELRHHTPQPRLGKASSRRTAPHISRRACSRDVG